MGGAHSKQRPVDGIHTPVAFEYADAATRLAATGFVDPDDLLKVARDQDTDLLFYIVQITPSVVWAPFAGASVTLTGSAPEDATPTAPNVGSSGDAARADHKHQVPVAAPSAVGTSNAAGSANSLARSDHVHSHGTQSEPTHHAVATPSDNGFMSSSDKSKIDGVAPNATATPLTASAPTNVTKATANAGVSSQAARSDHKHDIDTATPAAVGSSNQEGSSASLARSDHVHSHGNQGGGTLHSAATPSAAGFLSAADKAKLDALVFGTEYDYVESDAEVSTSSGSFQTKATLTVSGLPSGTYLVSWCCKCANNYNEMEVQLWDSTGGTALDQAQPEHRGTDKFQTESGFKQVTFSGARTFIIRYRSLGGTVFIKNARITIWRVS